MDDLAILVCGKTGVGKSTLVNSILRADLVPTGGPGSRSEPSTAALDSVTTRIEEVTGNVRGANIRVFDSPGLQDGTDRDDEYLDMMSKVVDRSDLVLYCFEMTASRWLTADKIAIELITKRFGVEFWSKCVVVLTKANQFQFSKRTKTPQMQAEWCAYCEKAFLDITATFKKKLQALLPKEHCEIIDSIPVIAAGSNEDDPEDRTLLFVAPDVRDQDYLAEMWVKCLLRLPPNEKRLAFLIAADFEEIRSKEVELTDIKIQEEELRDSISAANIEEMESKEDLTDIKSQEKNLRVSQTALSANFLQEKKLRHSIRAANVEEMTSKEDLTSQDTVSQTALSANFLQEERLQDGIKAADLKSKEDLTGIKSQEKNLPDNQTALSAHILQEEKLCDSIRAAANFEKMKSKEDLTRNHTASSANLSAKPVADSSSAQSEIVQMLYTLAKENDVKINLNNKQTEEAIKAKSESLSYGQLLVGTITSCAATGAVIGHRLEVAANVAALLIPGLQPASLTLTVGRVALRGVMGTCVGAGVGAGVGAIAGTVLAIEKWISSSGNTHM